MTPINTSTPEPTLLAHYPEASKKSITHAAGTILKTLGLEQRLINIFKIAVYRFLTMKDVNPNHLRGVLKLIEIHRDRVIILLSEKPCMDGNTSLVIDVIQELGERIREVLQEEQDDGGIERVFKSEKHNKTRRNTFPIGEGHTVSIVPNGSGFLVTESSGTTYIYTDYSVEGFKGGRYLTLYRDSEVVCGYALVG